MRQWRMIAYTLAVAGCAGQAGAQEFTGTLKKIKETGAITLGYREFVDPVLLSRRQPAAVGYAMDICHKIVDAVKKELKLDKLEVKLNPVTSSTRIPLMANGTIDLECGSTTNNAERQKQVAFTNTHFLTASRFVTKKSSKIDKIDDLKGKSVVSTSGTTNIKQLTEANAARNLGINIIPAKDHAEAFLMVETDRAVAFVMDDILLASLVAGSKDPDAYVISKDAFSKPEPYGIMLRKDDPAFKKVVDAATAALYTSGEGQKIYDKWFMQQIPPKGLNLNVPISAELKKSSPSRRTRRIRTPTSNAASTATHAMRPAIAMAGHCMGCATISVTGTARPVNYNWNWGIFLEPSPKGTGTYLDMLLSGLVLTIETALLAWVIALVFGSIVGVMRTLPSKTASCDRLLLCRVLPQHPAVGAAVPVVLRAAGTAAAQRGAVAEAAAQRAVLDGGDRRRPVHVGARRRAARAPASARCRAGRSMAATALGLTTAQTYRYVLLPMAFRIILPPLTSEFLNTIKNTSVALTIGLIELTGQARAMQEFSFQVFEAFTAATLLYLLVNIVVVTGMRFLERQVAIPGYIAGK